MIRMVQSTSAGHAKEYFSDALLKSDYYLDQQELQGNLFGKLSDRLKVTGIATKDNFFALCENKDPNTGKPLTQRTKAERTAGYDINFHVPKSVSVVHALSDDGHIVEAFQKSMRETMREIEADAKARVRKNGKYEDRNTGELAWAEFVHQTARPVDGSAPDPHLHAHCFVFNATYDETEKKIKAGQFRDIKRDMPYYQAMFHKKLSDRLTSLGYQVQRTGKSFEIEGVPQNVIDMFSKRSNEIGEFAKEKGITDAKELDKLGALTRSKKQKGMSMAELKNEWRRQIREHSKHGPNDKQAVIRYAPKKEKPKIIANDCVEYAMEHSFERASVVPERRLLETAYRHGIGNDPTVEDIAQRFQNDSRIIQVKEKYLTYCTTKEVLAEEKRMVGLARQGGGRLRPLYDKAPKMALEGQQADAAAHVLTTRDRVSIVRGAAGTGKTTMMKETVRLMEAAGKEVTVVAPTAEASRGVLAKEGFGDAQTVAKLLIDKEMQEKLKGQVLWVDEAGLLGTKDMTALLSLAERQNARLILGGDTRQHSSVIRGDALRILNTVGGIRTAEISRIYRQKNIEYRSVVENLSKGNVLEAFQKLDDMGSIKKADPMHPDEALVDDYMKAVKKGKSVLAVSPTHKQGQKVTGEIRKRLRSFGRLGKKEIKATKLENLNLTVAQKSDWRNFAKGQAVQFSQNVPNIQRGSMWSVDDVTQFGITIQDEKGRKQLLPRDKPKNYDVYDKTEIKISKGDRIRVTRNGFDANEKRLNNGTTLEVVSIKKKGVLTLKNPDSKSTYELDTEFGHIDHAYCVTSHTAQGKTVDEVFISQPAATFGATDAKQFYVSVSRGRDAATVYTDDPASLLMHASEIGDRQSAMELVTRKAKHAEYVDRDIKTNAGKTPKTRTATKPTSKNHQIEINYEPRF